MMQSLYNGPKAKTGAVSSSSNSGKPQSGEAIDISSDESGDEGNPTKSNGKSLAKSKAILLYYYN